MNKSLRIVLTVFGAIILAAACFLGGFFTSNLTQSKEASSYEWALKTIMENYYVDVASDKMLGTSLDSIVDEYLDIYSEYYTAEEYKELVASNSGSKVGVGVSYSFIPEGAHPSGKSGVFINMVVGNSPAYRSGLKAGEFVSAISYKGETTEFSTSADFSDCIDGIGRGEKFTLVTDRGEREVSKEAYTASYCTMSTSTATWEVYYEGGKRKIEKIDENAGGGISVLPEKAAYLKLDQFYGKASYEMAELIEEFNAEKCESLILDLRGNGGGYVDVMCDMAGIFTGRLDSPEKVAMRAVYKNGKKETYAVTHNSSASESRQLPAGTKVSVLADNGSASASEALIGVLIDNGVIDYGDIYISDFGEEYLAFSRTENKNKRTYGKGIMQTTFLNHSTGEALKLTTAKIYWPKGVVSIHDIGLRGDVEGEMCCKTVKTDWEVTYGDTQLAAAVAAIYG